MKIIEEIIKAKNLIKRLMMMIIIIIRIIIQVG